MQLYIMERDGESRVIGTDRIVQIYDEMVGAGEILDGVDSDDDTRYVERVWDEATPVPAGP